MANFDAAQFAASKAKPLPIILLLDESGSMSEYGKIEKLNEAVRKMLVSFKKAETQASEFLISIIAFGGDEARVISTPTTASEIVFDDLVAHGRTPLGDALRIAKELIEDKDKTPSRAYRPLVILVSDGMPTDNWTEPFEDFVNNGRSSKCDRMALSVGHAADDMLQAFLTGTTHEVFMAEKADEILEFFRFVTMSVTTRACSQNPNLVPEDKQEWKLPSTKVLETVEGTIEEDIWW